MGVAGRDYMRDESGRRGRWVAGRVTFVIIGVNVLLWIVFSAAVNATAHGPFRIVSLDRGLAGFIWHQLLLHPEEVLASGKIWQLFSAFWFHDWSGFGHVFWNMLALYFFGRAAEGSLGTRGYLKLYLLGGLVASLVLTGYSYLTGNFIPALGASGAVYAVLVWVACMNPHGTVFLMFILPLPMWLAIGVFVVGMEVLDLSQNVGNAGSAVAHLSGALWGFVYFKFFPRWGSSRGPGSWLVKFRRKRRKAVDAQRAGDAAAVKARVDALLNKISDEGMSALSEEEKAFLQDASKRFR